MKEKLRTIIPFLLGMAFVAYLWYAIIKPVPEVPTEPVVVRKPAPCEDLSGRALEDCQDIMAHPRD